MSPRKRAVRDGIVLGSVLVGAVLLLQEFGRGWMGDPYAYWSTHLDQMYAGFVPGDTTYAYSPVWAQAFSPMTLLPWPVFRGLWLVIGLAAALWLAVPVSPFWRPAFLAVCVLEVIAGNIILLLAVAAVVAMRHPAAWAFVLLSKVTPGVALGWYVGRREWTKLAVAIAATAVLAFVSFVFVPGRWFDWLATLAANRDAGGVSLANHFLPLWARLLVGAAVAVWGGHTNRTWTIPVAMLLGTPHIWLQSFIVLAAIPRLRSMLGTRPAGVPAAERPAARANPSVVPLGDPASVGAARPRTEASS